MFGDGAVFGGVGEGEYRLGKKVSGMDGCKPRGLDRKSCSSVEVAYKGADAGKVMGIQVRGSRAPLRQDRWMHLRKDRKTPKF